MKETKAACSVVAEQQQLRIVSDDLWAAVKRRQAEVNQAFAKTNTNKLARSHRPQYLLSERLECGHCLGPYAIMAKDRYGCTNRQKKLPIEHLGGIVCTNSKTISRAELEKQRLALQERLDQLPPGATSSGGIPPVINSSVLQAAIRALKHTRLSYTGDRGSQVWIDVMRRIISKVVIEPSADGKSADLAIHGHLAAILAAQEAWQAAGEFKSVQEKVRYLNRCRAILGEKEAEWMRLPVLLVAGAGFEPAAFRL